MTLADKAAIVTGSSRGVGRATALALAREGCSVLVNHRSSADAAEQVCAEVRALGAKAICVQADVARDIDCRAMVAAAITQFGRLDLLVNNAGTTRFIDFPNLDAVTEADWDRILATNVKGVFQMARAAQPHLTASGNGVIINVASVAGITGAGSSIPYCASKAAVISLTLSLARTLGPEIRVNAVAPGFIDGEWLRNGLGEAFEAARGAKAAQALLGKVSQPEDIATAILGLIRADMVTGHTLVVDGGHTAGPRITHGVR